MKTLLALLIILTNTMAFGRIQNYSLARQIKIADIIVEARISLSNNVPIANVIKVFRGNPPKHFPIALKLSNSTVEWHKYCDFEKVLIFLQNGESCNTNNSSKTDGFPKEFYTVIGNELSNSYYAIGLDDMCFWPKINFTRQFDFEVNYNDILATYHLICNFYDEDKLERLFKKVISAIKFSIPFARIITFQYLNNCDSSMIREDIPIQLYAVTDKRFLKKDLISLDNLQIAKYRLLYNGSEKIDFLYREWKSLDYLTVFNSTNATWQEDYMMYIDSEIQSFGLEIYRYIVTKYAETENKELLKRFCSYVAHTDINEYFDLWHSDSPTDLLNGGREQARVRTEYLFNEYYLAVKEKRTFDQNKAERSIRAMGVFAWETVVDKTKKGDELAVKIFKDIFYGQIQNKDDVSTCLDWWEKNKHRYTLPPQSPDFKGDYGLDKWKRLGR